MEVKCHQGGYQHKGGTLTIPYAEYYENPTNPCPYHSCCLPSCLEGKTHVSFLHLSKCTRLPHLSIYHQHIPCSNPCLTDSRYHHQIHHLPAIHILQPQVNKSTSPHNHQRCMFDYSSSRH